MEVADFFIGAGGQLFVEESACPMKEVADFIDMEVW